LFGSNDGSDTGVELGQYNRGGALPILHEDRLVGKLDATADRTKPVFRVHAIHEDVRFTRTIAKPVHAEIEALASWLGMDAIDFE
jgi:uncharacterized protein YcaQ